MSEYFLTANGELYHYGIKGMKWGVRRKSLEKSDLRKRFDSAKENKRQAERQYTKSFNEAYNKSISAYSPIKKHREENAKRWMKANKDARKAKNARQTYKTVKKERKQAIKSTYEGLNQKTSLGERLVYNNATRKKAAKYIVDNNMSVEEATKRSQGDARRNTAIVLGVYGGIAVGALIAQNR